MPADPTALVIHQGAAFHVVFDVTDDANQPIPLTGFHAAMQVRTYSGRMLLDLSTANGKLTVEPDGAVGEVHVDAGADLTASVSKGGRYDCLAWDPAAPDEVLVVASGTVVVEKAVTVLA